MGLYFTDGFRSRGFWWNISDGFCRQVGVDFAGGMRFRGFWWSMYGSFQLLKVVFAGGRSYRGSRTPGGVRLLQRPHIHLLF